MNLRKFYLIVCSVISIFMFCLGSMTIAYISFTEPYVAASGQAGQPMLDDMLDQYKVPKNESFNVLVMGGDKVNNNTDTMMLVNFNPYTAETSILSIPRDTKVKFKGKKAKINSAYPRGGGDLAVETLSDLLGIDIEYYVFINTSAFRDIINTLDGVDYYVPINMDYDDPIQNLHIHIKKGQQHFDGVAAERFMRFRQGNSHKVNAYYDGSDLKRIDAQQNFLKEVVRQKANIFYITKVSDILNVIFKNIDTDLSMKELLNMTKNLGKVNADQINMFKLPGVSENSDGWYYTMDEDEAFEIIDEHFSSKQP